MAFSKSSNAKPPPASGRSPNCPILRLSLEDDFSQVRSAAEEVQSFLQLHGCAQKVRSDCELAVVEGCNNAIKHRSRESQHEPVQVEVILELNNIELRITDHGPGFSWPKEAKLPEPEDESGRGLYLIRRLMDSSRYVRGKHENTLILRKKRRLA